MKPLHASLEMLAGMPFAAGMLVLGMGFVAFAALGWWIDGRDAARRAEGRRPER